MESIQSKFNKSDAICREAKVLVELEDAWYEGDKDTRAMNKIFIQRKKLKGLLDEYYKQSSLRKEE